MALFCPQIKMWNTELKFSCINKAVWIKGDFIKLQQVFLNIVKNAIEAMEDIDKDERELIIKVNIKKQK